MIIDIMHLAEYIGLDYTTIRQYCRNYQLQKYYKEAPRTFDFNTKSLPIFEYILGSRRYHRKAKSTYDKFQEYKAKYINI